MRKYLTQALVNESINRLEDAARTLDEFVEIVNQYDIWEEKKQQAYSKKMRPIEIEKVDWFCYHNQMLNNGDILAMIFCCVCQMHNLIDDDEIAQLVNKATDKQKRIFFWRIIRGCSPQKIAHALGMTDRNVRDMTDKMIKNVQRGLVELLTQRKENQLYLTNREKAFLSAHCKEEVDGQRPEE